MLPGTIFGMPKEKISVSVDGSVLALTDADANAAGLTRSEMVEQAMRDEHLRIALRNYKTRTVPALDIDTNPSSLTKPTKPPACDRIRRRRFSAIRCHPPMTTSLIEAPRSGRRKVHKQRRRSHCAENWHEATGQKREG